MEMKVIVIHRAFEDSPQVMAEVTVDCEKETTAAEAAYQKTQNMHGSWSKGEILDGGMINEDYDPCIEVLKPLHVTALGQPLGHRSSSVGDVMVVFNGEKAETYKVASFGFTRL